MKTYEEIETEVLAYVENCSAGSLVDLFNFIHNCNAEVEWDGSDNPKVIIKEKDENTTSFVSKTRNM